MSSEYCGLAPGTNKQHAFYYNRIHKFGEILEFMECHYCKKTKPYKRERNSLNTKQ